MMIVMKEGATAEEIRAVVERVEAVGASAHVSTGEFVTVIGAIGDREHVANLGLDAAPGVDHVVPILKPYKLASAQFKKERRTVVEVDGRKIGGRHFATIAGPCTVESREVMLETARLVKDAGAQLLRGGAYKPRTSPYSFQGLGEAGLRLLKEAKEDTGLPVVTELMDVRDLDLVLEVADVIQLGARSMQNFALLTEVGRAGRPVLLKRGLLERPAGPPVDVWPVSCPPLQRRPCRADTGNTTAWRVPSFKRHGAAERLGKWGPTGGRRPHLSPLRFSSR